MKKTIILLGPTASGKTDLSFSCLNALKGQHSFTLINADSLQIYRDLEILSARPSNEELKHHDHALFGTETGDKNFSVGDWCTKAKHHIEQAFSQGRTPFLVGGTGLYIDRLLQGLSFIPDIPQEVIDKAEDNLKLWGHQKFFQELCALDPLCQQIEPQNTQRLLRCWSIITHTGRSFYDWHQEKVSPFPYPYLLILLMPPRDKLYQNCDKRFDHMIKAGALFEAAQLYHKKDHIKNPTLLKALGIPQLHDYLMGKCSLQQAKEKAQQITRNYAKRQLTWFRNKTLPICQKHTLLINNPLQDQSIVHQNIKHFLES